MNIQQVSIYEDEFCEWHERIKAEGKIILRCIELSCSAGSNGMKLYKVTLV